MKKALKITDNKVELIKYIALLCMVMDHVNKYLFNYSIPYFFEAGRLAMPLFGIILAYNLSRESYIKEPEKLKRLIVKLVLFGVIATPFYVLLGGVKLGFWPLNILFTFAISALVIYIIDIRHKIKYWPLALATAFSFGGALVEFWHPAIMLVVATWWYFRTGSHYAVIPLIISFVGLYLINGNAYAVLVVPVLILLTNINLPLIRFKHLFYWFYPMHLVALLLIRIPMAEAGYLFFI